MPPRSWFVVASLAVLVACQRPTEASPPSPDTPVASDPDPEAVAQVIVTGRVIRDGAALPGVRVSYGGTDRDPQVSDDDGEFQLVVTDEFARAPALHLLLSTADGHRFATILRNHGGSISASFDVTGPLRVELHEASAEDQAWPDVSAWAEREMGEWLRAGKDNHAAHLEQWARIAEAIAGEPDEYRRGLMIAAQFLVGSSTPEAGLERSAIARAAIEQLGLDDPRWAINQWVLPTALFESGRWDELGPRLDELITRHPQPEVAAYIALVRYMGYSRDGAATEAAAVWQRWLERPALARTGLGPVMVSMGPQRPLAPGQPLPELCVEDLAGGELCLAELRGRVVVLEIWSTWCQGCREVGAELRAAHAALTGDDAPLFVSISLYDEPEILTAYLRDESMPWRHGWVVEAEREAVERALDIKAVPTLALIDADGTILASSPELEAKQVLLRIEALRRKQ